MYVKGLSPHTRGNPKPNKQSTEQPRSIPAHAGEPCTPTPKSKPKRVYPRTRGGTSAPSKSPRPVMGLSPHTRGNPRRGFRWHHTLGSIPAHAGEPDREYLLQRPARVYPRTRGGTCPSQNRRSLALGLSPHTRGNRDPLFKFFQRHGSIPAHAGEPRWPRSARREPRVYPRTRGGTENEVDSALHNGGLSPHTRGNRAVHVPALWNVGSIPAHAGEPIPCARRIATARVYPRTRGGTGPIARPTGRAHGLSPHTRGNPRVAADRRVRMRSIPAHAGEPPVNNSSAAGPRVYPRTRGGTSL